MSPRMEPRFVDVLGAAAMYTVSVSTFLRMADGGKVPWGLKLGGRRLWRIEELDAHISGGCKPVRSAPAK